MTFSPSFDQLGLNDKLLIALNKLGYERPSPVQAHSIPLLNEGRDILAQAQTGTGKTAAFALPILNQLNIKKQMPQALILAPTRELAIQVAEAFQSYAKFIPNFHVLPIYGGQDYQVQLRGLKRGPHVIVGTPGRVMDHLRRGTLRTDALKILVLDEADEMLRMGFIEDVEWVLEQIEQEHQTALFSATMPDEIRRIAKRFLKNPERIHIEPETSTVAAIDQYYILVDKKDKLEALTRYFEMEDVDAAIVFTGTKVFSVEIAERLSARGFAATALNGDMSQSMREKVIGKFKKGGIDIIVATEVAARGLDVERISHVINLDIPQSAESYIHRIGRTGRAGRSGKSLLFVTSREQRMLREIEKVVSHHIQQIKPPSAQQIQSKRGARFKDEVLSVLKREDLNLYRQMIESIMQDDKYSALDIAAAITYLSQKDKANAVSDIGETSFENEAKKGGDKKSSRRRNRGPGRDRNRSKGYGQGRNRDRDRNQSASSDKKGDGAKKRDGKKSSHQKSNRKRQRGRD